MPAWSAACVIGMEWEMVIFTRCSSPVRLGRLTLKRSGSRTTQAMASSLVRCSRVTLRTGQSGITGRSAGMPWLRMILRTLNSPAL